ncbi:MAG: FIST signal transduction protein [Actinomycetota bacterium]
MIRIGSALSTHPDAPRAAREATERALGPLGGLPAELVFTVHSPHHLPRIDEVVTEMVKLVGSAALLGCTSQAVVVDGLEVEEGPALTVWAGAFGGARIEPFSLTYEETPDGPSLVGLPLIEPWVRAVLLLGDPFSFPPNALARLNEERPGLPVIGGMASGGMRPGLHALILNDRVTPSGGVGVLLGGSVNVETLVSQGCKPIGQPYVVTDAEHNVIRTLGGEAPLERLRETLQGLDPQERLLAQHGLHVGVVIDEYKAELVRGDFLIRNVMGADQQSGAVAIGEHVHVGQTVQFHVRDASAADEDLRAMLEGFGARPATSPVGALLFTCNGRGSRLFGTPHHDATAVQSKIGPLPMAGMFCSGEIGPVGGQNFLHGFTASLAIFTAPQEEAPPRS